MNPQTGPLTADQRQTLTNTADRISLLPVAGCRDLSARLSCIAHTRSPAPASVEETLQIASTVRRALLADASPDRWLDDLAGLDPSQQTTIVEDLIAEREGQAEQISACTTLLEPLRVAVAPV